MKLYTIASLNKGAGVFDHAMRSAKEYPSQHTEMSREVAIGVVASAVKSGLSNRDISAVINGYFDEKTVGLLQRAKQMYAGPDKRFHLWHETGAGKSALHWDINYYTNPDWRISQHAHDDWVFA